MDDEARQIIEAMAVNEEKIMELYSVFAVKFIQDAGLWSKLSEDEKMHAGMVRSLGEMIRNTDVRFNKKRFSLETMQNLRERLEDGIKKANDNFYNKKTALEFALKLEKTLIESKSFESFESDIPDMKKLFGIIIQETQKHAKILEEYKI